MKVTKFETITVDAHPNLIWVQVHTDEGLVGLGETFFGAEAVAAHIHNFIAPYLLGQDAFDIERHSHKMTGYIGRGGSGAEMRGMSAVDIALWDIWGQAIGQPIHKALGGTSRDKVKVYNTCAGYAYVKNAAAQTTTNFGLDSQGGPYEDLQGFLDRPEDVAQSLLDMNISAMKIWPFDFAAVASLGASISTEDMKAALEPFERIRRAVGDRMGIMAELHSLWNVPAAKQICQALDEFDLVWIEDPVRMDAPRQVARVANATKTPIAGGELLGQRFQFGELLQQADIGVAIMDIVWAGGLTEARKVAALCDTSGIPFAAHDCTGPVALAASTHIAMHAPNAFTQEIVRAFYYGWYGELVDQLPPVKDGFIRAADAPGLGMALLPDLLGSPGTHRRTTTTRDI